VDAANVAFVALILPKFVTPALILRSARDKVCFGHDSGARASRRMRGGLDSPSALPAPLMLRDASQRTRCDAPQHEAGHLYAEAGL